MMMYKKKKYKKHKVNYVRYQDRTIKVKLRNFARNTGLSVGDLRPNHVYPWPFVYSRRNSVYIIIRFNENTMLRIPPGYTCVHFFIALPAKVVFFRRDLRIWRRYTRVHVTSVTVCYYPGTGELPDARGIYRIA